MSEEVSYRVPYIAINCEDCGKATEHQLQIEIASSVGDGITVFCNPYWFCTECYSGEFPCETDISWTQA